MEESKEARKKKYKECNSFCFLFAYRFFYYFIPIIEKKYEIQAR